MHMVRCLPAAAAGNLGRRIYRKLFNSSSPSLLVHGFLIRAVFPYGLSVNLV
jgi:hypothetical protein